MKDLIPYVFVLSVLGIGVSVGGLIAYDIEHDKLIPMIQQIDSLQAEIDTLQKFSIKDAAPGFIQIGETTIQCMTADPEKYLHIDSLTQGENFKDYAINDHQRVEMFIFNY